MYMCETLAASRSSCAIGQVASRLLQNICETSWGGCDLGSIQPGNQPLEINFSGAGCAPEPRRDSFSLPACSGRSPRTPLFPFLKTETLQLESNTCKLYLQPRTWNPTSRGLAAPPNPAEIIALCRGAPHPSTFTLPRQSSKHCPLT